MQAATAAILVLAANTAFADFPRLSSLLARDRFLPRQFANRGDRLVFSNGIVILAIFSGVLVIAFGGDTSRLIPLYAVGVFLSFTLSQSGMVVHWLRERAKTRSQLEEVARYQCGRRTGDVRRAVRFRRDQVYSWRVDRCRCDSAAGFLLQSDSHHYVMVAKQLSTEGLAQIQPIKHTVIVPISGIHRGVVNALQYARSIASDNVQAVYVDFEEEATASLKDKWERWGAGVQLVVLPSPYRELTRPLLRHIQSSSRKRAPTTSSQWCCRNSFPRTGGNTSCTTKARSC